MFSHVVVEVADLPKNKENKDFIHRLREIVNDAKNIGWGYGDEVTELFNSSFSEYSL